MYQVQVTVDFVCKFTPSKAFTVEEPATDEDSDVVDTSLDDVASEKNVKPPPHRVVKVADEHENGEELVDRDKVSKGQPTLADDHHKAAFVDRGEELPPLVVHSEPDQCAQRAAEKSDSSTKLK